MAWTQTDIDRLKKAIGTGAKRVEFGSGETRRVQEFRSLAEMWSILGEMEAEVASGNAPARVAITEYSRD